ncbi:hypothetical protein QVD17_38510 [Tagetes erecta]|uniref:Uncharacterized protein n=1 Tax=Tagetes erecta TaxID=13708 RepID=A0AAD8JQL7_TARER|nr:hypothetical protein QVD17_38510 [Tagetes erecta]
MHSSISTGPGLCEILTSTFMSKKRGCGKLPTSVSLQLPVHQKSLIADLRAKLKRKMMPLNPTTSIATTMFNNKAKL